MNSFTLDLVSTTQHESIAGVTAFVAEDASGNFSIRARHERLLTILDSGLARFCTADGSWRYLAQPGAVLYFRDNRLSVSTRNYWIDDDFTRISATLHTQLQQEATSMRSVKDSLRRLEEELLKRMYQVES